MRIQIPRTDSARAVFAASVFFLFFHFFLSIGAMAAQDAASETQPVVPRNRLIHRTITVDDLEREYHLLVPRRYDGETPVPLVFVFHGGAGHSDQIARYTRFNALAVREPFIAVYPQGVNSHWNDGRAGAKFRQQDETIDDVKFVRELLDALKLEFVIDSNAVFATGLSNGGIFSHRLGLEMSEDFAAIAPVIGNVAEPLAGDFDPEHPVSILIMNGTADPFVPYDGGAITPELFPNLPRLRDAPDHGRVVSTERSIELWLKANDIESEPTTNELPDKDPYDGCTIETTEWSNATSGISVVLYKVINGGHTYPGHAQYLPARIIGKTCNDIDATLVIWEFFDSHRRSE